jgi:hypothetical protein
MDRKWLRFGFATAAVAALTTGACSNDRDAHEGAPITVAGCLQKGDDDYLLTQVNRPSSDVPKSGVSSGDQVAREESRAATHTFRLNGQEDRLKQLIGRQIQVSGTTAEGSDVWEKVRDANEDAKDNGEPKVPAIKEGDLAKIDVTSVAQVADQCGEPAQTGQLLTR